MPGRRGEDFVGPEVTELATTTATYGRRTAPNAGNSNHQPETRKHVPMHASRIPIATEYLIMREPRSASGERFNEVTVGISDIVALA